MWKKRVRINEVKFQEEDLPSYINALKPEDCAELVH